MPAWRSRPDGQRGLVSRDWILASVTVWLGAPVLGAGLLLLTFPLTGALMTLTGNPDSDGPAAAAFLLLLYMSYALIFSPVISWAGLGLAIPAAWMLLARGLGGWSSFLVLGLVAGGLAGLLLPQVVGFFDTAEGSLTGAAFGASAAPVFRGVLFLRRREIFTAR